MLAMLDLAINMESIDEMFKDISERLQLMNNKFESLLKEFEEK